jgi:hypothetical protein
VADVSVYTVVYRPILPGQPGPEGLTFDSGYSAWLVIPTSPGGSLFGSGTYVADGISGSAERLPRSTGTFSLAILPATITDSTPAVTISGSLTDFLGVKGCTVTLNAALALRP